MKRLGVILALATLALTGCATTPPEPGFEERCGDLDGQILSDTTTKLMTGVVTGSVTGSNGVGVGTGVATSQVTFTMRLCIVSGEIQLMELE